MLTSPSARPADRYGTPDPRRQRRRVVVLAVVLVALAVGWAAWVASSSAQPVRWAGTGFSADSDTQAEVTFRVSMRAGATAVCTVQALNRAQAVVGLIDVPAGPATSGSVTVTATVPTSERAVAGGVTECALR